MRIDKVYIFEREVFNSAVESQEQAVGKADYRVTLAVELTSEINGRPIVIGEIYISRKPDFVVGICAAQCSQLGRS